MSRRSCGDVFLWYLGGNGKPSFRLMVRLVLLMVLPGIMAQLSSVIMQYIDASMVGHLGSLEAASVGLVSSSVWLIGGMGLCINIGHYVQVSQLVGAGEYRAARNLTRQSYFTSLSFSLIIVLLAWIISPYLPEWLGGEAVIRPEASRYFSLCILSVPFMQFNMLSTGILQRKYHLLHLFIGNVPYHMDVDGVQYLSWCIQKVPGIVIASHQYHVSTVRSH